MAFVVVFIAQAVVGWIIAKEVYKFVEQVVEIVIQLINILLGWNQEHDQVIEYFEVQNFPLFPNDTINNPLANSVLDSVVNNTDIAEDLIYYSTFRDMKGNFNKFMQFIVNGNYFEPLPLVESYIVTVDYDELAITLLAIHGEATTTERAATDAVNEMEWIQYWLQENKIYDVGLNELGIGTASESTTPVTPAVDSFTVTPSANHFEVDIGTEAATSDTMDATQVWEVDFGSIVYNPGTLDYSVDAFNSSGTITLPYTIPTIPVNLHYIVYYFVDSNPTLELLFIYAVGSGTWPELDSIEQPIDIDSTTLQVVPAVPLRISNANFTTFGATKAQQITDICALVDLDPQELVDSVLNDPNVLPGDIDNIYLNFGVRLKDTSEVGIEYLYNMCENLFAGQIVTKAVYDATPAADTKPTNTMIVTSEDNKFVFAWNYITFAFTDLATIDGDTGSVENGIYYSNLSKFDTNNDLIHPYYISSAKGTYNVGFKASTLTEVADFLTGSGTVNPGIVSAEGTNWLQVTTRMSYNNPSPVLLDAGNVVSPLIHLTPDRLYENDGAGVLRAVLLAAEETTSGQSITYYEATTSGLNAYTMFAPIGALRVEDGATGFFRMVKFNLAGEQEIMAPLIHSFISDRSKTSVTKLFLDGAHLSIYIARFEIIEAVTLSLLEAATILVLIIVVIVLVVISLGSAIEGGIAAIAALVAAVGVLGAVALVVVKILFILLVQYLIKVAIREIAKKDVALAIIFGLIAAIGLGAYQSGGLMDMTAFDMAFVALTALDNINLVFEVRDEQIADELGTEQADFDKEAQERSDILLGKVDALAGIQEEIFGVGTSGSFDLVNTSLRAQVNPMYAEHLYSLADSYYEIPPFIYEINLAMDAQLSTENAYI